MNHGNVISVFGILSMTLAAVSAMGAALAAEERPNVVFFVIDNVNFEHMGECYGGVG